MPKNTITSGGNLQSRRNDDCDADDDVRRKGSFTTNRWTNLWNLGHKTNKRLTPCCLLLLTKRCQTPVSIFTIIIFVFDLDDQPKNHLHRRQRGDNNNNLNDCYFGNAVQSRLVIAGSMDGWLLLLLLLSSSHCETLKMTMPGMPINFTWK